MVLLYVDALGMKARWASGSIESITAEYEHFEGLVKRVLKAQPPTGGIGGGIQSDAAAFVFGDTFEAVRFGSNLFRTAFDEANEEHRLWLRGLIVPTEVHAGDLVEVGSLDGFGALQVRHFSNAMLHAINIEQRFRGPRLLIAGDLITTELKDALAIPVGDIAKFHIIPLRELDYAPPPDRTIAGPWWDVLYLTPTDVSKASVEAVDKAVGQRIRWAAQWSPTTENAQPGTQEELAQLSLLSVMWAETQAIVRSVGLRSGVLVT